MCWKPTWTWLLFASTLIFACKEEPPVPRSTPDLGGPPPTAGLPGKVTATCAGFQWLYSAPGAGCATALPSSTWKRSPLFSAATTSVAPALDRYCRVVWGRRTKPDLSDIAQLDAIAAAEGWTDIANDCVTVSSAAPPPLLEPAFWPVASAAFLAQAQRVGVKLPDKVRPARVVVIDTAGDSTFTEGFPPADLFGLHPHGHAMAHLIRELACPTFAPLTNSFCAARVTAVRALARNGDSLADDPTGGAGTPGDVADAIGRAIENWELNGAHEELILNLSLGWARDGYHEATARASLPFNVAAAFDAIQHAACRGALVIAAAGNHARGVDPPPEPLFPAAWESFASGSCAGYGGPRGGYSAGDPIIYSAGGVDARDEWLANGRRRGHPAIAAPAQSAVVPSDPTGAGHTEIYTGSSVAAAVTSAIAAVAFSIHKNEVSARHIMQEIYAGGVPLHPAFGGAQPNADYKHGHCPGTCGVKRISVCSVMSEICRGDEPLVCPTKHLNCPKGPVTPAHPTTAGLTTLPAVSGLSRPSCTTGLCVERVLRDISTAPAVSVQPTKDPCPACQINVMSPGKLDAEISLPAGAPPGPATLTLYNANGTETIVEITPPAGGGPFRVDLSAIMSPNPKNATLSYKVIGSDGQSYSMTTQVMIIQ